MALKDRVIKTENGFRLLPVEEKDREAFFGYFTLKDASDAVPTLSPMRYYALAEGAYEERVQEPNAFVYIAERENGELVEEHRFFFNPGGKKYAFEYSIDPNCRYGKNAHIITLRWGGSGEPIHRTHIYLTNSRKVRYPFITKALGGKGRTEEKYVTVLPEGESGDNYTLTFSDLFLLKYDPRRV